jgi:hypothetical protein
VGKVTSAGWAVIDADGTIRRRYARTGDANNLAKRYFGARVVELWYSSALVESPEGTEE